MFLFYLTAKGMTSFVFSELFAEVVKFFDDGNVEQEKNLFDICLSTYLSLALSYDRAKEWLLDKNVLLL
jgi:hypothetical protein